MARIVRLEASNVKRLRAVEITPSGDVVVIGGENAQGKTSVLDSIAMAFGGKGQVPVEPIRRGEESAQIVCETEELVITRRFTHSNSYLEVKDREGRRFTSPQKILDAMTNALTFDPLDFMRQKPKDQAQTLMRLAGIDTASMDEERQKVFDKRTDENREQKRLKAQLDKADFYPDGPEESVSVAALSEQLEEANRHNALCLKSEDAISFAEDRIKKLEAQLEREREQLERLKGERLGLGEKIDTKEITSQIAEAETINAKASANKAYRKLQEDLTKQDAVCDGLTAKLREIDSKRAKVLAEASFPVEGLSISEDGTATFGGVPLSQASAAEQLRVSVAVGASLQPDLSVMLVRDGSLMDRNSMALLGAMAREKGLQIWVERVGDGDAGAVIIEDGQERGTQPEEQQASTEPDDVPEIEEVE